MPPRDSIDRVNVILTKVERLWKIAVVMVTLILSGVLWGARLEWSQQDVMKRMDQAETRVEQHGLDIATLKAQRQFSSSFKAPDKLGAQDQNAEGMKR